MKQRNQKLAARFEPETRFELRPAVATFRVTQETELEKLKSRLLQKLLNEKVEPVLNTPLRRAANEAAALAWTTQFPLLFFPTLLDEKARLTERQVQKQKEVFAKTRRLLAEAA